MRPNVCMWKYSKCALEMFEDWNAESSLCVGVEPILHPPRSRSAQALWWRITVNNCAVCCQEHLAWCWAGKTYEQSFLWPIETESVCARACVYEYVPMCTRIMTLNKGWDGSPLFDSYSVFLRLGCFNWLFWWALLICMPPFSIFCSRLHCQATLWNQGVWINNLAQWIHWIHDLNQCPTL